MLLNENNIKVPEEWKYPISNKDDNTDAMI